MERNTEETKGFQYRGKKIKGLWQGRDDVSFLSSFLYLRILPAHISALMTKGCIHCIKHLRSTLLCFLWCREPKEEERTKRSRARREVEKPLNAAGASTGKLRKRFGFEWLIPFSSDSENSPRPYSIHSSSYTCLIQ